MRCPDHGTPLSDDVCPRCRGRFVDLQDSNETWVLALKPESQADSPAFARTRPCPACGAVMAPWRLADSVHLHVERCPACGGAWLDAADESALLRRQHQARVSQAWSSLAPEERREMAQTLASTDGAPGPSLSGLSWALAAVGMPVILAERLRVPLSSLALALLFIVAFAGLDPEDTGYLVGYSTAVGLVSSVIGHADGWHLLSNLVFFIPFAWLFESLTSRVLLWVAVIGGGALAGGVQILFLDEGTLLIGASGGIAVLMGACAVWRPQQPVAVCPVGLRTVVVPLWAFATFELVVQAVMSFVGRPGVAWIAHLTGLLLGGAIAWGMKPLIQATER